MKHIGQRIGRFPTLGQVGNDVHLRVVRHEAVEDQAVDALRLRVGADPRIEIDRHRLDQKRHGAFFPGARELLHPATSTAIMTTANASVAQARLRQRSVCIVAVNDSLGACLVRRARFSREPPDASRQSPTADCSGVRDRSHRRAAQSQTPPWPPEARQTGSPAPPQSPAETLPAAPSSAGCALLRPLRSAPPRACAAK